jgi:hypothetical protein
MVFSYQDIKNGNRSRSSGLKYIDHRNVGWNEMNILKFYEEVRVCKLSLMTNKSQSIRLMSA